MPVGSPKGFPRKRGRLPREFNSEKEVLAFKQEQVRKRRNLEKEQQSLGATTLETIKHFISKKFKQPLTVAALN
ncbi:hypothetical protein PILCRDRAFT_5145 [Piloderma croceum F 1598]|uniref:Uncharacterized protein n=1 Tax=Piloderma croceum (strain F 1598) TaxID=765440 RepID=A0A0C3G2K5_PILCF|nr:hypothetical protein PILCRDRAFT_5145 [Piloderma croceum F 1598]